MLASYVIKLVTEETMNVSALRLCFYRTTYETLVTADKEKNMNRLYKKYHVLSSKASVVCDVYITKSIKLDSPLMRADFMLLRPAATRL